MANLRCVIAEDETLLREALTVQLRAAWPELDIVAACDDGGSALEAIAAHQPEVAFLDIRMPGLSGLEVAAAMLEASPATQIVFVTAYDQYAVQAFEAQAIDYIVKPVQPARLQKTVSKLQELLARRLRGGNEFDATLDQLRNLLALKLPGTPSFDPATNPRQANAADRALTVIQASVGNTIRMVPVGEVLYFEAADRYVRVLTGDHEYLLRTPLRELLPQLDGDTFWQIHRGTVVRAAAIDSVIRDEAGKLHLQLRGRPEKLPVSRLYAHLFKAM